MREKVFLGKIDIGKEKILTFILSNNSSDTLIGTKLLKNKVLTIRKFYVLFLDIARPGKQ